MSGNKKDFMGKLKKNRIKKSVIEVFDSVDMETFFGKAFEKNFYIENSIPIGHGQSGDDPVILAKMLGSLSLKKNWHVLEVGTGSGFSTALLSSIVKEVVTVEYFEDLAVKAKERLVKNGHENIRFFAGDATEKVVEPGEFDAVLVLAGCMNPPYSLLNMLRVGGIAVFPMGPPYQQQIVRYVNDLEASNSMKNFSFHDICRFDSIRGFYGWLEQGDPFIGEYRDVNRNPGENNEEEN